MRNPSRRPDSLAHPGQNPGICPPSEYDPLTPGNPLHQVIRPQSGFRDFACGLTFRFQASYAAAGVSLRVLGPTDFEKFDIPDGLEGTTPFEASRPCFYSTGEPATLRAGGWYDATLVGDDFYGMPTRFLLREVGTPPATSQSVSYADHPYARALSATAAFLPGKAKLSATRGALGATIAATSDKWRHGVLATNGKIYGVPFGSTAGILIIDTLANTASVSAMGAVMTGTQKWFGGALAANGKIYCAPFSSASVLVIDPITNAAVLKSATDLGLSAGALDATAKYAGAVLGADGKIYCIPHSATQILVIDPETDTAVLTTMGGTAALSAATKWAGAAAGLDGKIYCAPYAAAKVLVIDPLAGTARDDAVTTPSLLGSTWQGGITARDGRLVFIPRSASSGGNFLIVNPVTGVGVLSSLGLTFPSETVKWTGANMLPDGRILVTPRDATNYVLIAADLSSASLVNFGLTLGTDAFFGSVAGAKAIYAIPHDATDIAVVSGWLNSISDQALQSPFLNSL